MRKGLKLTDILVTILIALIFGLIYKLWGPLYGFVSTFGLHAEQLIYGMWFIAATVAFLIIRKPGVALLAEIAAAQGEFIFGGEWGVATLVFGIAQGLAVELVFMIFGYRKFNIYVVSLASIFATIASVFVDIYYGYIAELALWNLMALIIIRLIGAILISGIFAYRLVEALEKTQVTSLVRPLNSEDYEALGD